MSVLMEVNKISGSPTLIMKDGYKSLDYSQKLQCLVSIRTALEKEIAELEEQVKEDNKKEEEIYKASKEVVEAGNAFAVAKKVIGVVNTPSPFLSPNDL